MSDTQSQGTDGPTGEPAQSQTRKNAVEQLALSKNPCVEERKATYDCLSKNSKNKPACNDLFEAYNLCRERWVEAKKLYKRKMRS
eukprot:m.25722 g.25722  ORF g.25722 m.25722 type:complete len:85 (-) comp8754_c0_seq1:555-809(-)